jgi:hypothetical protein
LAPEDAYIHEFIMENGSHEPNHPGAEAAVRRREAGATTVKALFRADYVYGNVDGHLLTDKAARL